MQFHRQMMAPTGLLAAGLLVVLLLLAACGTSGSGSDGRANLTVYAAASLRPAFSDLIADFEAEHPDVRITRLVTDGSATLATQIIEGAPADVFAAADEPNMDAVVAAGLADAPVLFATNTLVVAVPTGNPGQVNTLADLARVTTVVCAPTVPCGAATTRLLDNAGVSLKPASLEQNVTAVREKVAAGQADAGLVYATDVIADAQLENFTPDGADAVINHYPIAVLTTTPHRQAAQTFVEYVTSPAGQQILAQHGFGPAN